MSRNDYRASSQVVAVILAAGVGTTALTCHELCAGVGLDVALAASVR
jgi:hypothetical protein